MPATEPPSREPLRAPPVYRQMMSATAKALSLLASERFGGRNLRARPRVQTALQMATTASRTLTQAG